MQFSEALFLTIRGTYSSGALSLLLLASSAFGQAPAPQPDFKIATGAVEHQVFQRNADGRANIKLTGTALAKYNNRYVEARIVKKDGSQMPGLDWTPFADRVKAGKWAGEVKGIPAGGPYKIEARVSGVPTTLQAIDDIAVGDLWVLAGQSNMEGVGNLVDVQQPIDAVHSFDMADNWGDAREPIHRLRSAADKVHWAKNDKGEAERMTYEKEEELYATRKKGAGLTLPFAVELYRRSGVPIGLVPCAHGGTSMEQWDPAKKSEGGGSLYGATMRRIAAVGGNVKGILWYQGEAEANDQRVGPFPERFAALVAAFRADTNQPNLPFYYVQIGRHVSAAAAGPWNQVQEAQRLAESKLTNTGMVASIDLTLDDGIHVSTPDLKRLGRRLAMIVAHDQFGENKDNAAVKRGPRPVSAKFANSTITLKFAEVNGSLTSDGRISGFSIRDDKGVEIPSIYKARFDAADPSAIVLDVVFNALPAGAKLYYGAGRDPYCNVRDTADMALPVFGPFPIQ